MNVIKKIYARVFKCFSAIRWQAECLRERLFGDTGNPPELDTRSIGNVLIIAPHSDDELIGCYGLISYCKCASVYYCQFCGGGKNEQIAKVRNKEIGKSAELLGFKLLNALDNPISLAQVLHNSHYDTIVFPSSYDWHPEHRKVSDMLIEELRCNTKRPTLYYYNVSMCIPHKFYDDAFSITFVEGEQERKWDAFFKIYVSQRFMPILRFKLQERLNARKAGELYVKRTFNDLLKDRTVTALPQNEKKLDSFVSKINNIRDIRSLSRKNYNLDENI